MLKVCWPREPEGAGGELPGNTRLKALGRFHADLHTCADSSVTSDASFRLRKIAPIRFG